jgi:hypothetical protein
MKVCRLTIESRSSPQHWQMRYHGEDPFCKVSHKKQPRGRYLSAQTIGPRSLHAECVLDRVSRALSSSFGPMMVRLACVRQPPCNAIRARRSML